ncbi:MAG: hypothetical protein IJ907_01970 [Prevotella sp.]|nr:hypothetical protein [Prevotella sp.]MBR2096644.1 hypothetical protein [Prevotella sp.]
MGRVRYGLKNMHYAMATEGTGGALTYGTPKGVPGAREISLAPTGESMDEHADDVLWFHSDANGGYSGNLIMEDTPECDEFLEDTLGMTKDADGVTWEKATDAPKEFALLGQFTLGGGTETGKRFCMHRVIAGRPEITGQTKENGITVQYVNVPITAMPRINDDLVKGSCVSTSAKYANWFNEVPEE